MPLLHRYPGRAGDTFAVLAPVVAPYGRLISTAWFEPCSLTAHRVETGDQNKRMARLANGTDFGLSIRQATEGDIRGWDET